IVEASGGVSASIDPFFDTLSKYDEPLKLLENTYETIGAICIKNPHHKMQMAWVEKSPQAYFSEVLIKSFDEESKMISDPFVFAMCKTLGPSACRIMLQHWSETLECPPPLLTDFDQKVQIAAYMQFY